MGSTAAWIVAATAAVQRAAPPGFREPQPAGTLAHLPGLRPASPRALLRGRLLIWHAAAVESVDCSPYALTVWDLASGRGTTIGSAGNLCLGWADWLAGGGGVLVADHRALKLYPLPADAPLPPQAPEPQVLFEPGDDHILIGMAANPAHGTIAVFDASLPGAGEPAGTVDPVLVNARGRVVRRVSDMGDLYSRESI